MQARTARRLFVPEVIQTSGMDCGPAALASLLNGLRIPVSYGRLREACHTDVDGTSIDTLEHTAVQLGCDAEQVVVPVEHALDHAATLPAIAVVRDPVGAAHFVVLWRRHGRFIQVMDPARGRLWLGRAELARQLHLHTVAVSADAWRGWAETPELIAPLQHRLAALGIAAPRAAAFLTQARADRSWRGLATLEAATRMVATLRTSGAIRRAEAGSALDTLIADASAIPPHYWSVQPIESAEASAPQLALRGAVLLRGRGARRGAQPSLASAELAAAVTERPPSPLREAWRGIREDGLLAPGIIALVVLMATCGVVLEAVLLRSTLELGRFLHIREQTLAATGALTMLVALLLGLELVLGSTERRIGRRLDARFRMRFLSTIPELPDSYFQTRPIADMVERSHAIHGLRLLPQLGVRALRTAIELLVTTAAIVWLAPAMLPLAATLACAAALIPWLGHSLIAERDLRVRTHTGALSRIHLDALRGRTAIDAHHAGATIEAEHERLLGEWMRAAAALHRSTVAIETIQLLVGLGLAGWLIVAHVGNGNVAALLLLAYWVLNVPTLGYELALYAREYPVHRSTLLRLLEPLTVRPEAAPPPATTAPRMPATRAAAVRIEFRRVSVAVAEQRILEDIDLRIEAGSHLAIVGPSGAGKSTLTGLLLGWHRSTDGDVLVDDEPLTTARLETLRREIAWVDPSVHIWNRSLLDNLTYGSDSPEALTAILDAADLVSVLAKLPDGLATRLSEQGAPLSAGEAQRVRLARAMRRQDARLVVLDEPFAGLERDRRTALLGRTRRHWRHSTLLCVTHDVNDALLFERVLVVEHGRIIEDGAPNVLAGAPASRFGAMLHAQQMVDRRFHTDGWRHTRLDAGRLHDERAYDTVSHAR